MSTSALAQQRLSVTSADQIATLRLIAEPGPEHGRYAAGIDLTMAPGSHTYWKSPGESGVPPVFAFNGSENVATAEVAFPVPTRMSEDGIEAYGYQTQVVFPVSVEPTDPARPVRLHLDMTYAVCNKICIPAHGEAHLTLTPGGAGVSADAVGAALAEVPAPASTAEEALLTVVPKSNTDAPKPDKPAWYVSWRGGDAPKDVFVEAPEGFYLETKKLEPGRWLLTAEQSVSAARFQSVTVSLVAARQPKPFFVRETLDVGTPSR